MDRCSRKGRLFRRGTARRSWDFTPIASCISPSVFSVATRDLICCSKAWSDLMCMDRKRPKPLLVIAGNGPESEKAQLRERAANLGIDQETLRLDLGYIPAAKVPLYMQAADVLLYPYREITTSGALLAGLNYCKPIVASDLATFRNYLDPNVNALVVTPGDRNALTKALAELRDHAVFARLEAGSRNNGLLQMQWEEIAALTAKVYGTVVE